MTTNIHFIGGEKGGVGKSLMARVLAQYLIDRELPFLGFDTDRSHGALMRFYAGYASPVAVDKVESLDAIVEAAVDQPGRRILVDLAAQTHDPLATWMEDAGVDQPRRRARHEALLLARDGLGQGLGRPAAPPARPLRHRPATTCWCATRCAAATSACSSSRASRRARSAWARTSSR